MAIATRNDRSSILLLALAFGRVFPDPDGALTGTDRQHVGLAYRGISALAAKLMALYRGIRRGIHSRVFGRVNRREDPTRDMEWRQ